MELANDATVSLGEAGELGSVPCQKQDERSVASI